MENVYRLNHLIYNIYNIIINNNIIYNIISYVVSTLATSCFNFAVCVCLSIACNKPALHVTVKLLLLITGCGNWMKSRFIYP